MSMGFTSLVSETALWEKVHNGGCKQNSVTFGWKNRFWMFRLRL